MEYDNNNYVTIDLLLDIIIIITIVMGPHVPTYGAVTVVISINTVIPTAPTPVAVYHNHQSIVQYKYIA